MAEIRFKGLELFQQRLRRTNNFRVGRNAYHAELTTLWQDAAEAFIRAAMRNILVQTGMSAASFLELSRAIKRQGAEEAINAVLAKRTGNLKGIAPFPNGKPRRPGGRGIRAGRLAGRKAYVFNTGSPARFGFRFNFQTVVFQHSFHEDQQKTLQAGFDAFEEVIAKGIGPISVQVLREWLTGRRTFSPGTPVRRV